MPPNSGSFELWGFEFPDRSPPGGRHRGLKASWPLTAAAILQPACHAGARRARGRL